MQNAKKIIIILLGILLVVAFFLPWLQAKTALSAWDLSFGKDAKMYLGTRLRYGLGVIPLAGLFIALLALLNKNFALKPLLYSIPLLTLAAIGVYIKIKMGKMMQFDKEHLDFILSLIGIGVWLTLVPSVILPFLSFGKKAGRR